MMSTMKKLTPAAIDKKYQNLSSWRLSAKKTEISKVYTFPSFLNGLAFIARIAVYAEVLGHHPDIELSYGHVKVTLTTHEVGGLSNLDFELAKRIDAAN